MGMAAKQKTKQVRRLGPFKDRVEQRGLSYTTARDHALRGELPYFKFGRAWYVDEDDLDAFIERAKVREIET
jgi:hypothetical protein